METATINMQYPVRVWGISIVLGSVFVILHGLLTSISREFDILTFLGGTFLAALLGFVYSVPAFIVYYFSFRFLLKLIKSKVYLKLILSAIAILSMIVTFYFMLGKEFIYKGNADIFISYAIGIIIAGQIIRISKPEYSLKHQDL
jgi:hypothetical protein